MAVPSTSMGRGADASVCVAISVRDGVDYLGEAVESVLAQDGVELELRLYDNGSTDGSVELCRSYAARDPRVSVTENGDGLGYYDSLDLALAATRCRYFAPFAADDVMFPGNLAAKIDLLERTGAGLAHSRAAFIDEAGAPAGVSVAFDHVPEHLPAPQFLLHTAPLNKLSCQSVVVRTSAFRWVGGFDASAWYCGDWLAWMRLALRVGVVTIREPLIANRQHGESGTSGAQRSGAFAPHCVDALERVLADEYFPGAWEPLRAQFRAGLCLHLAGELERYGHLRVADGHGAYAYAARALACPEAREPATALHRRLLARADLHLPVVPFAAVARAPRTHEAAGRLVAAGAELFAGGTLGTLQLVAEEGTLDDAASFLRPLVETLPFDVDLTDGALEQFLAPGASLLAPASSPDVARAESLGVPVVPYDVPLPPAPWLAAERAEEIAA